MAKYELLQIVCEKETILFASDKAYEIKRRYDPDNRPIKEYKPKKAKVKVESSNPHNWKPVIKVSKGGGTIKRFKSLTDAAVECGYGSAYDITKACNTGLSTSRGDFFQWGARKYEQ